MASGIACHIDYLQSSKSDGWVWASLGQLYLQQKEKKFSSMSTSCYKQAAKLQGKLSGIIQGWHFLGPFTIGKYEIDGDPVESFGGIENAAKQRLNKKAKHYSELISGGEISWEKYRQNGDQPVVIGPHVNWGDLVNSLGSTGITEWQGWVVGEFAINENNININIQCLGVSLLYVDSIPIAGDVYSREKYWFSVNLSRGVHTIYVKLRGKIRTSFKCSIKPSSSHVEILQPSYIPDLYNGHLFGTHITLPVSNLFSSKWISVVKISVQSQSSGQPLKTSMLKDKQFDIAPGQTRTVNFRLTSEETMITDGCDDIDMKLKVVTSEGQFLFPIHLRCRKKDESVIFTFLDHDGSVQHAAAIHPIQVCVFVMFAIKMPTNMTLKLTRDVKVLRIKCPLIVWKNEEIL